MTRETKIGLLVGLAFIIVIGILLSDHLTSTSEPPQARLAQAGNTARQAISVPGQRDAQQPVAITPPQQVTPVTQVPTAQELAVRPQPVRIEIGPGGAQAAAPQAVPPTVGVTPPLTMEAPVAAGDPSAMPPGVVALTGEAGPAVVQTPTTASPLVQVAQQMGAPLVAADGGPLAATSQQPAAAQPAATAGQMPAAPAQAVAAAPAGQRTYKAVEGDTVSRLAGRFMGGNTKANRDAIVKANPSLQRNPDVIIVGQTYVIPTAAGGPAPRPAAAASASPAPRMPSAVQASYTYTVKPNDSLWAIASTQLGNPAAVAAIKELNKDVLRGGDVVQPGMTLRLPAKPLASAN